MQETNDHQAIVGTSFGRGKHSNVAEGPIPNQPVFSSCRTAESTRRRRKDLADRFDEQTDPRKETTWNHG